MVRSVFFKQTFLNVENEFEAPFNDSIIQLFDDLYLNMTTAFFCSLDEMRTSYR